MKKYILLRTLRSLLSIFVVTALTYTIIYTMVPRRLIFRQDPNYNKIAKTADSKANYEKIQSMNARVTLITMTPRSCRRKLVPLISQ